MSLVPPQTEGYYLIINIISTQFGGGDIFNCSILLELDNNRQGQMRKGSALCSADIMDAGG